MIKRYSEYIAVLDAIDFADARASSTHAAVSVRHRASENAARAIKTALRVVSDMVTIQDGLTQIEDYIENAERLSQYASVREIDQVRLEVPNPTPETAAALQRAINAYSGPSFKQLVEAARMAPYTA